MTGESAGPAPGTIPAEAAYCAWAEQQLAARRGLYKLASYDAFMAGWAAAAPVLRAEGAAAERERIRQLAIEHHAVYERWVRGGDGCERIHQFPFASLLAAVPGQPQDGA